ncbi:MAG TPA: hypothetical protein VNP98_16875 [Chthoniobacterales bacterium]|nr:hypothetical protein [Chthoniobacterales bacterium]
MNTTRLKVLFIILAVTISRFAATYAEDAQQSSTPAKTGAETYKRLKDTLKPTDFRTVKEWQKGQNYEFRGFRVDVSGDSNGAMSVADPKTGKPLAVLTPARARWLGHATVRRGMEIQAIGTFDFEADIPLTKGGNIKLPIFECSGFIIDGIFYLTDPDVFSADFVGQYAREPQGEATLRITKEDGKLFLSLREKGQWQELHELEPTSPQEAEEAFGPQAKDVVYAGFRKGALGIFHVKKGAVLGDEELLSDYLKMALFHEPLYKLP